ncbi:hypothetical protein [Bacillus sp. FJAT-29814]|uniref:hypothetical protein n=1 Tax=Bacillus sp. FJAT-29814 TaxID=1729688 RepID=UPI00082F9609|nr:hypothetical protein [Bacillus sp. FJAT-29814]
MPSVINVGLLNINSPQPSSAIFIGEGIVNGMDANRKQNLNQGGIYGINTINAGNINNVADSFEIVDGVIFDQDFKPASGVTI